MRTINKYPIKKFFKKIYKIYCKNFCKCKKNCPPPVCPHEPPECEQRRKEISGDVFEADNGWQIGFVNVLQTYAQIQDPLNLFSCEGTFGGGWHISPMAELEDPSVRNTLLEMFGLCSVVVWATDNGVPTLVKVIPGSDEPARILPTPSLSCLAYSICINSGG